MTNIIECDGQTIELDKHGYLVDYTLWTKPLADKLAKADALKLTEEHWEIIRFVRHFYITYNTAPAIRALTKALKAKFGEEKSTSRYLFRLFPEGPAKQAAKYAGLPKPARCL